MCIVNLAGVQGAESINISGITASRITLCSCDAWVFVQNCLGKYFKSEIIYVLHFTDCFSDIFANVKKKKYFFSSHLQFTNRNLVLNKLIYVCEYLRKHQSLILNTI